MTVPLELLAVAALLLLNAFFVAAAYGLVTAPPPRITEPRDPGNPRAPLLPPPPPPRITELRDQGNRRARLVLRLPAKPNRFIAAMQLGVTITSLAIGALGEPVFAHIFDTIPSTIIALVLAFSLITYL